MSTAKLEKGVPLPARRRSSHRYPWSDMEIGDSFVAPMRARNGFSPTAKLLGIRVTVRKIDDNTVRVWRIA